MDFKSKLRNPKIQQYGLEIIFPIASYFFWDWTVLLIVVFYLLDYLASHVMFTRRLMTIQKYQKEKVFWIVPSSALIFLALYGVVLWVLNNTFDKSTNSSHLVELTAFAKDELWFLFPVILLSYFMMDKMFFYMPRRFMNHKTKKYFFKNVVANLIATVLIVVAVFLSALFRPHDLIIIFSIIVTKLGFDFGVKKTLLKIDI